MIKEFKQFVARGNLIEIAVGLVIALAFKSVVDALIANVLTPIVAALFGQPDFSSLRIALWNDAVITYGLVLNTAFSFLAVAAALFFFVVKPYNVFSERLRRSEGDEEEASVPPPEDIVLLREIRDALQA